MTPERRTNNKPRRKGDAHPQCLMKEDWATLNEHMSNFEESFRKFTISQNEINTNQNLLITKISHKIYGNATSGMDTIIKLNKQTSDSSVLLLQGSLKRLWWLMVVVAGALIGNIITIIVLASIGKIVK